MIDLPFAQRLLNGLLNVALFTVPVLLLAIADRSKTPAAQQEKP